MKKFIFLLLFVCVGKLASANEDLIKEKLYIQTISDNTISTSLECTYTVTTSCGQCWTIWLLDCTWENILNNLLFLESLCEEEQ